MNAATVLASIHPRHVAVRRRVRKSVEVLMQQHRRALSARDQRIGELEHRLAAAEDECVRLSRRGLLARVFNR